MLSSSFGDISLTKYRISGVVLFSFDGVVSLLRADLVFMLALNGATPRNYFFNHLMLFLRNSIKKCFVLFCFYGQNKFEASLAVITHLSDASISLHTLI